MLPSTPEEKQFVADYYLSQSPDAAIKFLQKVYSESIIGHKHDVWDVHASDGRWWVITNPTNLYSQDQFPNMDYAVTLHMGLCLRIPRTDQPSRRTDSHVGTFAGILNEMHTFPDYLGQSRTLADYQSLGVKCRELLLKFISLAQDIIVWPVEDQPQRANFRAWSEIIFNTSLGGDAQKERRHLLKTLFNEAWTFSNWLTHSKSATWHDAEVAQTITDQALGLGVSLLLRVIRQVPDQCPSCGSPDLSPQEGRLPEMPDTVWERPVCEECGWTGLPVRIDAEAPPLQIFLRQGDDGNDGCFVPGTPLTTLKKPGDDPL